MPVALRDTMIPYLEASDALAIMALVLDVEANRDAEQGNDGCDLGVIRQDWKLLTYPGH